MSSADWSPFAFIVTFVLAAVAMSMVFVENRQIARGVYWVCAATATTLLTVTVAEDGRRAGLVTVVMCAFLALGYAFFQTPFIKVGDRIFAARLKDQRPDADDGASDDSDAPKPTERESYDGEHSTATVWWSAAFGLCLLALGLAASRWDPVMLVAVAVVSLGAAYLGYDDGHRQFPIARGHRVSFGICAAASLAAAGIPLLVYLYLYRRGRNTERYGKHDAAAQRRRRRLRRRPVDQ